MGGDQKSCPPFFGGRREQGIPLVARRRFHSIAFLLRAMQDISLKSFKVHLPSRAELLTKGLVGVGFSAAQLMIDMDCGNRPSSPLRLLDGQQTP